jgi:ATP-dependent exoDNAse (exonuclease V) beta subunit
MNDKNFMLYRASAGSGKTYTLVREFLTLCLSSDNVTYNNILAVTFTNKAANEMKAKILNHLKGIMTDDPDFSNMKRELSEATQLEENKLKERAAKLYNRIIHNYSDLNVSTIDSFIQQVSRTFARELNLPNQYKLMLDKREFLDEFIQQIDKEICGDEGTLADTLSDYVKHKLQEESKWRLDSSIKKFVEKLLKESAYKKGEGINAKSVDKSEYVKIYDYINEKAAECKKSISENIQKIEEFNKENGIIDYKEEYNRVLVTFLERIKDDINITPKKLQEGKTLTEILSNDKKWNKGKKVWPEDDSRRLIAYFNSIVEKHKSLYLINIIKKDIYLYVLRGDLLEIINNHIKETNKVHISEFNKRISDIIADCSVPFIYERIGSKYEHLFIDEFQDTSLLQWFNFLPLVSNSISNGNKTLLVGDAKQAIYRFRSGEVEQIIKLPVIHDKPMEENDGTWNVASPFDEYESSIRSSFAEYELETNHRPRKNVVVFNNSLFKFAKDCLSETYKEVYAKSKPQKYKTKVGDYEGCVNVKIFKDEKDEGIYKSRVREALVDDIKSLSENNEDLKYSDIAILVRNKEDGNKIAEYLAENDIPVISSDSIMLRSSNKVLLIIFTLKYMVDEKSKVNKLNLSFYQYICKNNTDESCNLAEALKYDIKDECIEELRRGALSLYDLCMRIIEMHGFDVVSDVFLQYFMNMVQNWQNADNHGINAFLEYWNRKSDDLFVEISGKINAVQILTIHKSKGLEYKVVMYPYVYTSFPNKFHSGEKWLGFNKDFELLKDMPCLDSFILPVSSSLEYTDMESHYFDEVEKQAFDDFNLMYVAMTRARDILYIYTNDKCPSSKYNIFNDYFSNKNGCLAVEHDELLKVRFKNMTEDDNTDNARNYVEYQFGEIEYHPSEDKVDANEIKLSDGEEIPDLLDWYKYMDFDEEDKDEESESIKRGNLIHEIFSKIITYKDIEKVLRFYVYSGSIDESQSEMLLKKFEKISQDERIRDAYSEKAIIRNEMEILTDNGKKRPDRYAELDDKIILIDYKTGKKEDVHKKQLREYASVVQQMGVDKNIEMYLIYVAEENEIEPVFLDRLFY